MAEENPEFYGEWKSYNSENFDAFFQKLGMNFFVRKMANLAHPTMIIERVSDTQIKIVNKTPLMENSTVYTYGEPTPVKNPNGESLQIIEWKDGKMMLYIGDVDLDPRSSGRDQVREITPEGELLATLQYDGVVAKRWFKKVN